MADAPVRTDEVLTALYGEGAWEIAKALTEKQQRTQARVGLASNILGITAGAAALGAAARNPALRTAGATAEHAGPFVSRALPKLKLGGTGTRRLIQAGAGGALGLQVANTAGDVVANRVLARESKKDVAKSLVPLTKEQAERKGKLLRVGEAAGKAAVDQAKKETGFTAKGTISKRNDEKRQVFGWASVVEIDGVPVVDYQNDYLAVETIEKAAYDYVHSSRRGGDMHTPGKTVSHLIESFMVTPEKKELLKLPPETPTGWWVGFQVDDDEAWELVKAGKRPEFSIHGSGTRVDVEV